MRMIKSLDIPFESSLSRLSPIEQVSQILDGVEKNEISNVPWLQFSYKPDCAFAIAHSGDCIFLKFFVVEKSVKARYNQPNDPVYQDSCVEFFISFNGTEYYNFEFNAIGTCYLAHGVPGNGRVLADIKVIEKIKTGFKIESYTDGVKWELTAVIPVETFNYNNLQNLGSINATANFYKCGDELPVPHFITWAPVEAEKPNFHLPQFFGNIHFAAAGEI